MLVRFTFAALLLSAAPAFAELQFCNKTDATASVAIGYKGGDGWTSEGWWNVDAGACKTVVSGDLDKTHYYWRAESASLNWAHEQYLFCTSEDEFTIIGDEDCGARGFDQEGFNEIELAGKTSFTMNLTGGTTGKSGTTAKKTAPPPAPASMNRPDPDDYLKGPDNGPGTYGEPYTIVAEHNGCWASAEVLQCDFLADGWTYVVSEEGPTPLGIIDALNTYDIGTQMQLSGDMISYSGSQAQITVRDFEMAAMPSAPAPAPAPQPAGVSMDGLMDHIQGNWFADYGADLGWMIEGNRLRVIVDANISEEYFFEIHRECAASYGRGPVIIGYPEIDPAMGPACFLVTETGPRHLAVEDVVEGNTISFSYSN